MGATVLHMAVFLDHHKICADILEYADTDLINAADKVHNNALQIILGLMWEMINWEKISINCIKPFIYIIRQKCTYDST